MRDTPEAGPAPDQHVEPRKIYAAMSGLIAAFLVANLDHMIVSTALPTIAGELGGFELLSWVIAAFTLTTAVSTPIWGKLGDLYDRKAVFITAFSVFLAGSALCGAAQDMIQLIAFRAVQGLGAGGLLVGGIAIVGALVPRRERAKYQGLMATIMPLAILSGPLLGGLITDTIGWRWAFYLNLPVGALALWLLVTRLHLPAQQRQRGSLDLLGALALTTGLTALSLVTTLGGSRLSWSSPAIILLAAATAVALLLFIRRESKVEDAIVPLPPFRVRNFSLATFLSFASGLAMFGAVTFLPLYQQIARGGLPHEHRPAPATASGRNARDRARRRHPRDPHGQIPPVPDPRLRTHDRRDARTGHSAYRHITDPGDRFHARGRHRHGLLHAADGPHRPEQRRR